MFAWVRLLELVTRQLQHHTAAPSNSKILLLNYLILEETEMSSRYVKGIIISSGDIWMLHRVINKLC